MKQSLRFLFSPTEAHECSLLLRRANNYQRGLFIDLKINVTTSHSSSLERINKKNDRQHT